MCGIFGWLADANGISAHEYRKGLKLLLTLSESRGKEASGICAVSEDKISVIKKAQRAKKLAHSKEFKDTVDTLFHDTKDNFLFAMGHARMVTNGNASNENNNQPVIKKDMVCIHNGIIVNDEEIWERYPELVRNYQVDTESLLELLHKYNEINGYQFVQSLQKAMKQDIKGSVTCAVVNKRDNDVMLYTNVGSLYYVKDMKTKGILFASEQYILEQFLKDMGYLGIAGLDKIVKVEPDCGLMLHMKTLSFDEFDMDNHQVAGTDGAQCSAEVDPSLAHGNTNASSDLEKAIYVNHEVVVDDQKLPKFKAQIDTRYHELEQYMKIDIDKIRKLKRCSVCLLPETFPGITFDKDGKCSMCQGYKKRPKLGKERLLQDMEENSRKMQDKRYDCILPISGGRDSCYIIHYAVKELGLKPVAYTYDWGMVTDLARRNIQRMCSELQVEHVLISADITRKRQNVQKNVSAWLKKPTMGTIPLFMAGDKQFFYYAQLLKKQMHIGNILFGQNSLEETNFKVAYTGIQDKQKSTVYYDLSKRNKMNLCLYYGEEFLKNPAYLNSSLLDSFGGFASYYLLPKDYLQFFDYMPWDEKSIVDTIINQYDWELSTDTNATWRIGDGTAAFYNYIYYRVGGFSEFDTFKSNQIREGMITREEAMAGIEEDNKVRTESFQWYCDTIGIDAVEALKIINKMPTRY